ncbi:MAG: hypothetical protein K8R90_09370 [Candidatus Cloacimonetes bacterium]|nr:hypothetical protein [Candidatus Cloacimonadota bacterium]
MAWIDCVLSTPGSLARIEREVNGLAGSSERLCYSGDGTATIAFHADIAAITWYDEDGRATDVNLSGDWTLPEANVCRIIGFNASGDALSEHPCDEGVQLVCRDIAGGGRHAALSAAAVHGTVKVGAHWHDKIALARTMLERKLENALTGRGIRVNETAGQALLDVVANPRVFALAGDYLTLHLIYADLAADMGKEVWFRKAEWYQRQFDANFAAALRQVNLDTTLDGVPEHYRTGLFSAGRITR